jgi:hypothetical protein
MHKNWRICGMLRKHVTQIWVHRPLWAELWRDTQIAVVIITFQETWKEYISLCEHLNEHYNLAVFCSKALVVTDCMSWVCSHSWQNYIHQYSTQWAGGHQWSHHWSGGSILRIGMSHHTRCRYFCLSVTNKLIFFFSNSYTSQWNECGWFHMVSELVYLFTFTAGGMHVSYRHQIIYDWFLEMQKPEAPISFPLFMFSPYSLVNFMSLDFSNILCS